MQRNPGHLLLDALVNAHELGWSVDIDYLNHLRAWNLRITKTTDQRYTPQFVDRMLVDERDMRQTEIDLFAYVLNLLVRRSERELQRRKRQAVKEVYGGPSLS